MSPQGVIRKMVDTDLDIVLSWRNDLRVRVAMFERGLITPADHKKWFEAHRVDDKKTLLIYEKEHVPLGFLQFSLDASGKTAMWGFYTAPSSAKGSGTAMGKLALEYAFSVLRIHKVFGQVIDGNIPSLRMHERLGFSLEGCLRQHYFDGHHYKDVLCFGKIASDGFMFNQGS